MYQEKGNATLVILILILIAGLAVAVYLVQQTTNILPKASEPVATAAPIDSPPNYQTTQPSTPEVQTDTMFSGYQNPFEDLK